MTTSLLSQQVAEALQRSMNISAESVAHPGSVGSESGSDSADELVCSICLQHPVLEQIASVKGCDHAYCVKCILRWAAHREAATCPQCKLPFDTLMTYLQLDGSLCDFPQEESVVLLKRAHWFTDHMQAVTKGSAWRVSADDVGSGFTDYDPYYRDMDDVDEVEDYYFSAAAGQARIVLGNRRLGENGFIASGRRQATPRSRQPGGRRTKKGGVSTATTLTPASVAPPRGKGHKHAAQSPAPPPDAVSSPAKTFVVADTAGSDKPVTCRTRQGVQAATHDAAGNACSHTANASATGARLDRLGPSSTPTKASLAAAHASAALDSAAAGPSGSGSPGAHKSGAQESAASHGRPIPSRSNRRPGGTPASSSYRCAMQASADDYSSESAGVVSGSSFSGSSPLGSSPGYGRRAKRNLSRTLDDEMAALRT